MFRKKHYNELNRNEKMIVQEEYKKDENYSVLMTYIFYLFVFESVVAFIKGLIIPSDLFYILFVILIYLIYDLSKIKKWYDAICAFDVHISELGSFSSKRTVYTLDNVSVFFYHKNSDGIGQEIILKNKFFRKRKLAGKSKDL